MLRRAIIFLLLTACPRQSENARPQSCLDQQLEKRGLNQYGDPPDTMYTGGTPLFDEKTGKRTDREAYVFAKHPDIAGACRH
ncbi:MAG: hypothetical protein ABR567_09020 [Myxococcales bacterium]|nr:hypothetical protein [Myxococcales bacterium]